jgi:hypothetical protein
MAWETPVSGDKKALVMTTAIDVINLHEIHA